MKAIAKIALISYDFIHLFSPLTSVVLDTEQALNTDHEWIVWRAALPFPTELTVCGALLPLMLVRGGVGKAGTCPVDGDGPHCCLQALMPDTSAINYNLLKNTTWAKQNLSMSCIWSREQICPARYVTDLHVSCRIYGLHLEIECGCGHTMLLYQDSRVHMTLCLTWTKIGSKMGKISNRMGDNFLQSTSKSGRNDPHNGYDEMPAQHSSAKVYH